ncbi:hypothetical protein QHG78_01965 [Bacteroides sp. A1-P5]|jgi:hypothetical protein|uniref:Uncharacterized protein n=1 Tax=Bacteroides vicugnae TaxID=3037989 RepID=A0ABU5HJW3_9BACE|nr:MULTISPECIES: hypothetical protein [unclassified Bacteroides]MDY7252031.1 hypothetical protein [Bacteroides sp. A1-P5]MDY7256486.1 hypothetical protein [Bacteroides sp. A2-P53]RGY28156.1 hypothetical protein DXA46_23585 [Bacteroides sp. OF02-3LB]
MKNSKKTPTIKRERIGNESYGRAVKSPTFPGANSPKRKKHPDRCYDFTSDHDINPPREERKKK